MRRFFKIFCVLCVLTLLFSCSYVGDTDFIIFEERFNNQNKEFQIDEEHITREENDEITKYSCFFNAESGGEYLMTVSEKSDVKVVSSCTLCILSSLKLETSDVKSLFCSMMYAYNSTNLEDAEKTFKKLGLEKEDTYKKNSTTVEKADDYNIKVIVNGAGTSITIY